MSGHETIIIIDFGSQYTQLITRRIRETNVYSEVFPHDADVSRFKNKNVKGIILSGGPLSVYDEDAPKLNPEILNLKVPLLGICYGLQLLCLHYGGKVKQAENREYGKAKIQILYDTGLFENVKNNSIVWMSHGDYLTELPGQFKILGKSDHSPIWFDNNTIGFLSTRSGSSQVWTIQINGGEAKQLTNYPLDVHACYNLVDITLSYRQNGICILNI